MLSREETTTSSTENPSGARTRFAMQQRRVQVLAPTLKPRQLADCVCVCVGVSVCALACSAVALPLHTVREPGAVVGGGGVVPSHGIQEVVVRGHAHSPSPLGHGRAHAPFVGVRIKTLHRPQARAAVSASHCKEPVREGGEGNGLK